MDVGEFFCSPKEPSYVVMSEDGRAHYGRRPRVVELLVPMCCTKCEEKVRENMLELEGVQGVLVDPTTLRVTVTGFVDPMRTLKKARKVKRDAQLLSAPDQSHLVLPSSSSKRHHAYTATRSEHRRYLPSPYHVAPPTSSSFVHHQLPARHLTYRTSHNRHITPAISSYGRHHVVAHPNYVDEMVITNPRYGTAHTDEYQHDGYWH